MATFLQMGGFAWFVWPCYALCLGGMIWLALTSWLRARAASRQLGEMAGQDMDSADRSDAASG